MQSSVHGLIRVLNQTTLGSCGVEGPTDRKQLQWILHMDMGLAGECYVLICSFIRIHGQRYILFQASCSW